MTEKGCNNAYNEVIKGNYIFARDEDRAI